MMVPVAMFFPKHSYLTEAFNQKLMWFSDFGLIRHWASAHMDMKYLIMKQEKNGPKKLNMVHLSSAVQMLIGGFIFAFLVFVTELLWRKLQNHQYFKWLAFFGKLINDEL